MKKRILSALFCLCMIVTLLPAAAMQVFAADPATAVDIGGVTLNATKPYYVNGAASESGTLGESGCTAQFDATSGTLTLNGFSTTENVSANYNSDLIVILVGENSITTDKDYALGGGYYYGNITIGGNGTLNVSAKSRAISVADGTVTINGGTVVAKGGEIGIVGADGVNITGGNVTGIGGTDYGIDCYSGGIITLSGGNVIAKCEGNSRAFGKNVMVTESYSYRTAADGEYTSAFAENEATSREGTYFEIKVDHIHCICGKHNCNIAGHEKITYIPWSEAIKDTDKFKNGYVKGEVYVYLDSNITIDNVVRYDSELVVNKGATFNLCLNGNTMNVNGKYINVGAKAPINNPGIFNLCDCGTNGTITGGNYNAAIEISGGIFTMYSGTVSGNTQRAVYLEKSTSDDSIAKAHILGGTLSGNSTTVDDGGGAIFVQTGDLVVGGDAVISGNSALKGGAIATNSYGTDGMVSVAIGGDAVIKNNTATYTYGGAVYIGSGTNGGTTKPISISGNVQIINNKAKYSAAVCVYNTGLTISDNVQITGNRSSEGYTSSPTYYGAVHYYEDASSLTIEDNVVIYGNYVGDETSTVQCNLSVSTSFVDFTKLDSQAKIGVYCINNKFPTEGTDIQVSTAGAPDGSDKLVKADNPECTIVRKDDGILYMTVAPKHQHTWDNEWSKNDTHHWYKCTDDNCEFEDYTSDPESRYAAHEYDQTVANEKYLKTGAVCGTAAVYYKSCVCGAFGDEEHTFIGDVLQHEYVYNAVGNVITETCANGCAHSKTATITAPEASVYDGQTRHAATVTYSEGWVAGELTISYEGTSYSGLSYSGDDAPIDAGLYTASIKYDGKTASVNYIISPLAVDSASIVVSIKKDEFVYNGEEHQPEVSVSVNGQPIFADSYTVEYKNNVNAGTAEVTVTLKGNYIGSGKEEFTISKAPLTVSGVGTAVGTYGTPLGDLTVEGLTAYLAGNEVLGTWKFVDANIVSEVADTTAYKVVFTPDAGADNYEELTAEVNPTIVKADYTLAVSNTVMIQNCVVNSGEVDLSDLFGAAQIPDGAKLVSVDLNGADTIMDSVTITNNGKISYVSLDNPYDTDKSCSYDIVVSFDNYNDITATLTFKSTPKTATKISGVTAVTDLVYDGKAHDGYKGTPESDYNGNYEITYTGESFGGESYKSPEPPVNAGTYTVTFKIPDTDPVYAGETTVNFTIAKAKITVTAHDINAVEGDDTPELGEDDYTVSGLIGDDVLSVLPNIEYENEPDMTSVGEVEIIVSGASVPLGGNYDSEIVYVNGKLTISDKPIRTVYFDANGGYVSPTSVKTDENGQIAEFPMPYRSGTYIFLGWFTARDGGIRVTTETVFTENMTVYAHWQYVYIPSTQYFTLTFDTGAGSAVDSVTVSSGTEVDLSEYTSELEGYDFDGWFYDEELTEKAYYVRMTKNITVYASFTKIDIPDTPDPIVNPFTDIFEDDWYFDSVMYVYENGLMNGTGDYVFSPEVTTTRGMIVTILWRLEGEPDVICTSEIFDVPEDMYYTAAVKWAVAYGILEGYGDGLFGPDDLITREQMVTILWRYAEYKGIDVYSSETLNIEGYNDDEKIGSYAVPAMKWAISEGIIGGNDGCLMPEKSASRAETAVILHRFCELIKK